MFFSLKNKYLSNCRIAGKEKFKEISQWSPKAKLIFVLK